MSPARIHALPLLLAASSLWSQGIFTNVNKPGDATCPRVMKEKTDLNFNGWALGADSTAVRYTQKGDAFFEPGKRKDVSAFAAYNEKGKATTVASLKGKVVLVGLWSKNCDPSAKMLLEFASLYDKRAKFGFEILAVNFDENQQDGGGIEGGWRAINKFRNRNREVFEATKLEVYIPGLGKEGPSNFMDMVWSLPVLYVIDREGRLAEIHVGYQDGFVGQAVMRALRERPQPAAPPAAPAQPAAPPAP